MTQIALTKPRRLTRTGIGHRLWQRLGVAKQRRALARLDDRALDDIGITRAQARTEAARPIWDAPLHWHKCLR
ncbi:DUF1127 domain-containing protein [Ruegeria sp.]|uniref:DUF1127 domain-containing protein n=1 Tax=Ruegeria sp. TaxID=1879320 RepID=UPI00230B5F14|nr:DUF1127 domain-containing protein [Ruegeria sp.]MDA7967099.1 DUF1127 domain-containing protein [Ruegeria sp.]